MAGIVRFFGTALAAALLMLSVCGCGHSASGPVAASPVPGCDPAGMSFLDANGCAGTGGPIELTARPTATSSAASPTSSAPADACPDQWGAVFDSSDHVVFGVPGTYGITPGSACEAQLEQWSRNTTDQLNRGLNGLGFSVATGGGQR